MPMTYSDLIAGKSNPQSIQAWVNNTTVPSAVVLEDAQAFIASRLRIRDMRVMTSTSIGQGVPAIALPTRFRRWGQIVLQGTDSSQSIVGTLTHVDYDALLGKRLWDESGYVQGIPRWHAEFGTSMHVVPAPDQGYALWLTYYAAPPTLGTDTESNFVTDKYPRMLRAACLGFANEWMKDDGEKDRWLALCEIEIAQANRESDEADYRGLYAVANTRG